MRILANGETYGYQVSAHLKHAGFGEIKGGTLYPLLKRLERDGLVDTQWQEGEAGPGRKYYALTATGKAELHSQIRQWSRFADVTTRHFSSENVRSNDA